MGSGAPSGKRNGQYRHGEGTKVAIAEQREFSALLKMAPRWPDVKFVMACGDFQRCLIETDPLMTSVAESAMVC